MGACPGSVPLVAALLLCVCGYAIVVVFQWLSYVSAGGCADGSVSLGRTRLCAGNISACFVVPWIGGWTEHAGANKGVCVRGRAEGMGRVRCITCYGRAVRHMLCCVMGAARAACSLPVCCTLGPTCDVACIML